MTSTKTPVGTGQEPSQTRREGHPELPSASALVCCHTFDRLPDTLAAIRSLVDQTIEPHEIVVSVDNNPELAEELERTLGASVVVVRNSGEGGETATRNVGIAVSSGDIIAFLDDDAVAEPDWLERLLETFLDPTVMVAGGQSVPAWERGQAPTWFPREYQFIVGCTGHTLYTVDRQVRNTTGSNMAVRKEAFDRLGGWSRDFGRGRLKTGGGEAELCLRIKHGFPDSIVVHEPSAIVHHKVPRERSSLRYVLPYAYHEGIVRARLRKYLSRFSDQPLAGEQAFLRNLIFEAIPSRLRTLYRPASVAQLAVIIANTGLVAVGYLRGRLTYR